MSDPITRRIESELGLPHIVELLEQISGSDFHSLLLLVLKRRVDKIEAASLLSANAATQACSLDARQLNKLESLAYELAPQFDAVQLSPVTPLGAVNNLTGLDQGNVLSSIRALECASDPTIGLALESARRRKPPGERKAILRLCTNQRVLRFPLPQTKGYTAHFNLFALVSAGRDTGSFSFELSAFFEQIDFYLDYLSDLNTFGYCSKNTCVEISDTRVVSHLCAEHGIPQDEIKSQVRARDSKSSERLLENYSSKWDKNVFNPEEELASYNLPQHLITQLRLMQDRVVSALSRKHKEVHFSFNLHRLTGLGYYDGPCFHIKTANSRDESFMLADGGFVDWTRELLADSKERLLTSAIGIELICRLFRQGV